jgi:Fur family iron response transcriptional regulator
MMILDNNDKSENRKPVDALLSEHGIFATTQRKVIAEVLFERNQHLTAEQLYDLVKKSGAKVSRATVYNTLGLFAEKGLVREIFISASKTYYDSNTSRHHHFFNVDTCDLIDMRERLVPLFLHSDLPQGTAMDTVDLVIRVKNSSH